MEDDGVDAVRRRRGEAAAAEEAEYAAWSAQLEAEMREMQEEDAAVKIQAQHRGAATRRAAQPEAAVAEAAPASSEGSGSEDADRLSSSSGTEGERGVPEAAAAAEQVLSLSDYASLFLFMWSFVWGVVWEGTCNKVLSPDLAAEASAVERASAAHARELAAAAAEVAAAEAEMAALQAEVGIGHGRVVAVHHPLTLSIPDLRIHSVPLFLKRRCDRNPRSTAWPPQRSRQCTAARRRGGAGARPGSVSQALSDDLIFSYCVAGCMEGCTGGCVARYED
jgi:hypothetical protein